MFAVEIADQNYGIVQRKDSVKISGDDWGCRREVS
jgi:hypothetical protein